MKKGWGITLGAVLVSAALVLGMGTHIDASNASPGITSTTS